MSTRPVALQLNPFHLPRRAIYTDCEVAVPGRQTQPDRNLLPVAILPSPAGLVSDALAVDLEWCSVSERPKPSLSIPIIAQPRPNGAVPDRQFCELAVPYDGQAIRLPVDLSEQSEQPLEERPALLGGNARTAERQFVQEGMPWHDRYSTKLSRSRSHWSKKPEGHLERRPLASTTGLSTPMRPAGPRTKK